MTATRSGTVVEVHGVKATVLPHTGDRARIRCRLPRGRRETPVIGDRVTFEAGRHGPVIAETAARAHTLTRKQRRRTLVIATHVDRLVLVSAVHPPPRPGLVDRVLVGLGRSGIAVTLVVNKADLAEVDAAVASLAHYEALGIELRMVSAVTGAGVDALRARLHSGMTVLMGHSGVGKSTLLNQLVPGAAIATGDVNTHTGKGRHTTTVTTCHELGAPWPAGGLLVDTPGIRIFPLEGLSPLEIAQRFPDFEALDARCRFSDCLHRGEPDCAVADAVASGNIGADRMDSYERLLDSLDAPG